jgi:hypothetical protein
MYDLDIKKENPIINTEANESIIEMLGWTPLYANKHK